MRRVTRGGPRQIRFFFSSRRRHTRFDCDWSSDVCSSDLPTMFATIAAHVLDDSEQADPGIPSRLNRALHGPAGLLARNGDRDRAGQVGNERAGEGRVGGEGRYRWVADHLKKKKKNIRDST